MLKIKFNIKFNIKRVVHERKIAFMPYPKFKQNHAG